jgi:hypothetical protein
MLIHERMDLTQLACVMGQAADRVEAQRMRERLCAAGWQGSDTENVPRFDWIGFLDAVAMDTWRRYA